MEKGKVKIGAGNFEFRKVYANGEKVRGFVPVYENGVLKAKHMIGLAISIR